PGVSGALSEGAFDLWPGGLSLPVLREGHPVVRGEPPVIAVARGELVEQVEQRPLLPGAARAADQAVGEGGGAEQQGVARAAVQGGGSGTGARGAAARPARSRPKRATCPPPRVARPATSESASAIERRAAAASPRSSSVCALAAWGSAKPGSAAIARSNASI